ncbi:MAG: dTDP-4-dehydrorhamnose reductase [Pseudomonadota bacterium]
MKLLVTGANGQVGWELVRRGEAYGFSVDGFDRARLDITDENSVSHALAATLPDLVINAAAYTAVDKAESDADAAFRVNCDGPAIVAAACAGANLPLIHLSTDYVFDGSAVRPYREDDPVAPLGVYGRSKEAGEVEVRRQLREHIILRTAWVYGVHGQNFVKTMVRLGREREELAVVADQIGCPTCAADLAEAILVVAGKVLREGEKHWGTYHCCGKGEASWYRFAREIFELARAHQVNVKLKHLKPITTADYPTPARRPINSRLDCSRLQQVFGIEMPDWRVGLSSMLNEFCF